MTMHRLTRTAVLVVSVALYGVGPASASDLFSRIVSFLGISATPSQMKAPDEVHGGDVWVADANRDARARLTIDGGYSWPVFDPDGRRILALKAGALFEIPLVGGQARLLMPIAGIVKLVGFDREYPGRLLALRADQNAEIVVLSPATGEMTAIAYDVESSEDRLLLAHLRGEERAYRDTILYLRKETRSDVTGAVLEWTDVFIREADKRPRNISLCDGVSCSQPSLSGDHQRITFIRAREDR
jgi:hypothetical protein